MSDAALNPWTMSYYDIAAYVWLAVLSVAVLGSLWLMGRLRLRTYLLWGLVLLVPLALAIVSDGATLQLERLEVGRGEPTP